MLQALVEKNVRNSGHTQAIFGIILYLSVVQKNMRVTRQIVLPFLTKALYEFGCFKGIL